MYAIRKARLRRSVQDVRQASPGTRDAYYDPHFRAQAIKILPGEYLATDRDVMLVTLLGSCVSACIHDPIARVGGMNHFMLPAADRDRTESARYGGYAMEMLINDLLKLGGQRARMEAKVFGGAAVLPGMTTSDVGTRNAGFVRDYLATEGIRIVAEDLLDVCPRRVHYFPRTGRALVRRVAPAQSVDVLSSEERYFERLRESPTEGTVELFGDGA